MDDERDYDLDHDRIAATRAHNRLIDDLDREIAEELTPEYQAERERELAAIRRWDLPSARTPRGTRTAWMDDRQVAHADQQER